MAHSALLELWDAFDAGDADRIRAIFSTTSLGAEKAQDLLWEHVGQIVRPNEVTRALLDSGASGKDLPLSTIGKCCSIEVFRLLAKEGLDFNENGYEILEDFVQDREIIDFLLDHGADINRPNGNRDTRGKELPPGAGPRLFDKTLGVLNNTAALGDIELFDHLVSRGADVSKSIALHTATRCSSPARTRAMIEHLIEKYEFDPNGDDNAAGLRNVSIIDGGDDQGKPLEFAICSRNLAAVRTLFEKGADPNIVHPVIGPVSTRAVHEFPAAVESFLVAGADANIILRTATKNNNVNMVELCLRYEVNPQLILKEIQDGNLEVDPQIVALLSDK